VSHLSVKRGVEVKLLVPKMYQESIYTINYDKLKKENVKCLLFDLDNTCVGYHEKFPTKELEELFNSLTKKGFKVIIFTNASQKRLVPLVKLHVICHSSSKKPFKKNFNKIMKKYKLAKEEICIIGDQLFTDILGGNKVGIRTCLVNPVTNEDFIFTKIFRFSESVIFRIMAYKDILIKGEYYE